MRRFAEPVEDAFAVLVDADNLLGRSFGFKAIPNGIFVRPDGVVDAVVAGKFDIRRPQTMELVDGWLAGTGVPRSTTPGSRNWSPRARELFLEASAALRKGDRGEAIRLLRLASPLEPDNLIIRKQLWAVEHPERFYSGDIDREWQREQMEQDRPS